MSSKPSASRTGFARVLRALCYSANGLRAAWRDEAAFRQELLCFALLAPVTALLPLGASNEVLLFSQMLLVLIIELLNSGLEAIVDKASPEQHVLAGKAKDCASAAVLLSCLLFSGSWLVIAGPAAWHFLCRFF